MCRVHTGAYVSLLAPGKTDFMYRLPPKKDYHVYIARSTYHYAYARQTQVNWKSETKRKKKTKEGKEKTRKRKNEKRRKEKKTRKARRDKTRRGSKESKREKKKSDPRN